MKKQQQTTTHGRRKIRVGPYFHHWKRSQLDGNCGKQDVNEEQVGKLPNIYAYAPNISRNGKEMGLLHFIQTQSALLIITGEKEPLYERRMPCKLRSSHLVMLLLPQSLMMPPAPLLLWFKTVLLDMKWALVATFHHPYQVRFVFEIHYSWLLPRQVNL